MYNHFEFSNTCWHGNRISTHFLKNERKQSKSVMECTIIAFDIYFNSQNNYKLIFFKFVYKNVVLNA